MNASRPPRTVMELVTVTTEGTKSAARVSRVMVSVCRNLYHTIRALFIKGTVKGGFIYIFKYV